jgi:hypothetical protein
MGGLYSAALAAVPCILNLVRIALAVDYERALEFVAKQFADHAHFDHARILWPCGI